MAILELERVSYTYSSHEGQVQAVRELSLQLRQGELLGVIGHTGSGKSTLLQLMCGLLAPSSGEVRFHGQNICDKKLRHSIFTQIGIAFQYPERQLFAPTVFDDIAFVLRNAKVEKSQITEKVRRAMATMRLDFERYAHRSPFELSGGEMRRVALAGVIVAEPQVLILDEPAAGLDPQTHKQLLDIIRSYHARGNTVVLVSHSMDNIALLSDKVLVLKDGACAMLGSTSEVFSRAKELRDLNLGQPQAAIFAEDLRNMGLALPDKIFNLEALADAIAQALGKSPHQGEVQNGL